MPAGDYQAEILRPGYRTAFAGFTVAAGEETEVEVGLRRESATLRLRTAPADAIVLVDGYERGRTKGAAEAGFAPQGTNAWTEREAFSRELWIDDLPAGPWRVEVRKEGYRTWSAEVPARRLDDETLPPIVLEPERGVVVLKGLPEDADVLANGRAVQPNRERWTPEVLVPPGVHTITVSRGVHGYFETSVTVEDGGLTEVDVELRPALAFLGVFGSDEAGRRAMASAIDVLREETAYAVLDRAAEGAALLDEFGVEPAVLRSRAASARLELDWKTIQRRFRNACRPRSIWPPSWTTIWWRKRSISGGGRRPPDRLGRMCGICRSRAVVWKRGRCGGCSPPWTRNRPAGRSTSAPSSTSPWPAMHWPWPRWNRAPLDPFEEDLLLAAAASRRLRELDGEGDIPRWLLELDLATLLLGTAEAAEAARRLAAIDVAGLEETAARFVRYTLGLALASLAAAGPDDFRQRAREVFEEVASSNPGRFPAMRARLRADSLNEPNG